MKTLAIAASMVLVGFSAMAQGTVSFSNVGLPNALFRQTDGTLLGNTFSAQLFAGPSGAELNSLQAVGAVASFITGGSGATGLISAGTRTIANVLPGAAAVVQIRIWSNAAGSYEAAQTTPGAQWGFATVNIAATGGLSVGGNPPSAPAALTGLQGISLTTTPVPEPGVMGLAAIGGLGLLALRRKSA